MTRESKKEEALRRFLSTVVKERGCGGGAMGPSLHGSRMQTARYVWSMYVLRAEEYLRLDFVPDNH